MAAITLPRVVRLRRREGRVVQDCDVYIGRACQQGGWDLPASKWANPFSVARYGSVRKVLRKFEEYLAERPDLVAALPELAGQRLGCWCHPNPCHGDVLVAWFKRHVLPTTPNLAAGEAVWDKAAVESALVALQCPAASVLSRAVYPTMQTVVLVAMPSVEAAATLTRWWEQTTEQGRLRTGLLKGFLVVIDTDPPVVEDY